MTRLWENFNLILEQEVFNHQKLLELLVSQKDYIKQGSVEGIEQTSKKIDTLVMKLKILAEARLKVTKEIGLILGIDHNNISLSNIINYFNDPYLSMAKRHYNSLAAIALELKKINMSNFIFFKHSLNYVQNALQILINGKFDYTKDGLHTSQLSYGCINSNV